MLDKLRSDIGSYEESFISFKDKSNDVDSFLSDVRYRWSDSYSKKIWDRYLLFYLDAMKTMLNSQNLGLISSKNALEKMNVVKSECIELSKISNELHSNANNLDKQHDIIRDSFSEISTEVAKAESTLSNSRNTSDRADKMIYEAKNIYSSRKSAFNIANASSAYSGNLFHLTF